MATNDRGACLVFFFNLPDFCSVFLGFYTVNFPCFRGNRVNIQGVLKLQENLCINFGGICNFVYDAYYMEIIFKYSRAKKLFRATLIDRLNRDHSEDRGK